MTDRQSPRTRRLAVEAVAGAAGLTLLLLACLATPVWFERHFLPELLNPRADQLRMLVSLRVALAAAGLVLVIWVRPALSRSVGRIGVRGLVRGAAPSVAALLLGLVAAELLLEARPPRAAEQAAPQHEPRRRWDDRAGWLHIPARIARDTPERRGVVYAFDANGYRVRSLAEPVDLARPSIVFVGESIVAGNGLHYDETLPARVAALTGLQAANLGVGGYATDQAYMRLGAELPKFRDPKAVVVLFMPALVHRNLDTDRPHLDRGLAWRPPAKDLMLVRLARRAWPYRTEAERSRAVALTREQLQAIAALASARGARTLVLAPQIGAEAADEAELGRRILDGAGVPYVRVRLDPTWRLRHNRHPDGRAAGVMADAVAAWLRGEGGTDAGR